MRKQEIFSIKWSQINTVNNQLTLPETKSGRKEIVRLNNTALEALKSVRKKGDYVFCTRNGKRLKSIRRSWYTLVDRLILKISGFTT